MSLFCLLPGMHSGRSTVLSGKLPSRPDFEPSLSECMFVYSTNCMKLKFDFTMLVK